MSGQRIWVIWGIASLIWLLTSAVFLGTNLSPMDYGVSSSLPAPLLSRSGCSGVVDDHSARACLGIADIARQRRALQREAELRGSLVTGTIIVGPPLAGVLIAWGVGHASARREAGPRVSTVRAHR